MVTHLFPNFLTDPCEYAAAEAYWAALWERAVTRAGQPATWRTAWLRTTFADGTRMADGNPIFSAICPSRGLAVRIIQHEPESDEMELTNWDDTFDDPDANGIISERVIACALSVEAARRAEELIEEWLAAGSAVQPSRR